MRVYIASLSDYNNGRLEGKWFNLSYFADASQLMDAINDMLNNLTEKYKDVDGEVREEWAVHDYEGIPPTLASEYMGEEDFQKLFDIEEVAQDRDIPVEVLVERAGDTGSDDYQSLADSLVMVVDGSDETDIVYELEDQLGELGNDFWKDYIFIDDVTERVMYGEDVDRYREDILYENPDMDEEEAERQAEEMADEEADRRRDLSTYLEDMGYGDEIPDFVTKDYNDAWKYALSYDYDVIHHDGEMYVFTNNYSLGGTILSGLVGAYIGYKIGRAKPQKKGFSTEKKIGRKIKGAFSKKKFAGGGGVAEYWKPIDKSSIYRGVHDYSLDGIDDDETPLEGEVWIKFKSIPKGVTNLPYEVKRAIESDFEYYGYSNSEYPKSVDLNEGSWFDYYISFRNLTYNDLEELLVKLPEQVAESLEEQGIEGYGELGFNTYGNYIDAEISSDYEAEEDEDEYEYAKGGSIDSEIAKYKKQLINKAKTKGLYENFGQNEVRKLEDKYGYTNEVRAFDNWAMNFDLSQIDRYAKGGGVDEEFYVGQTIKIDEDNNPYGKMTKDIKKIITPYLNKELVIEEITIKKPHNIAKAYLKSSGEKVPFDIVLNKKYIQTFAGGGGIGFKGLSAKVAKRYAGKKVAPKYRAEYGKRYSKSEAKEVGDKVAGKVYWQQKGRKMAGGGKAIGLEWMYSDGQYEAHLGELYLIISRATERGLYQVRVTKGYRGETIGESTSEISGLDNAKDLAYDIAGDYYKQYARGGNVNTGRSWHLDRARHNKRESYEKTLANRKRKYEDGGQIGQEIVFDDNGEENTGVIKDITNLGDYVVKADDGRTLLAQRDLDVISLGAMRSASTEAPRKRFGFFEDGGSVSGNQNKRFLDSLDISYKQRILRNIANHYGISIVEAEEEVTDSESENLYEYITDTSLRMKVYNDMKNRRYAQGGGVEKPKYKYYVEWLEDGMLQSEIYNEDEYEQAKELYYQIKYDLFDSQYKRPQIFISDYETGEVVFGDAFEYARGGGVSRFKEGDRVTNKKGKNRGVGFIVKIDSSGMAFVDFEEEGKTEFMSLEDLKKTNQSRYEQGGGVSGIDDLIRG